MGRNAEETGAKTTDTRATSGDTKDNPTPDPHTTPEPTEQKGKKKSGDK